MGLTGPWGGRRRPPLPFAPRCAQPPSPRTRRAERGRAILEPGRGFRGWPTGSHPPLEGEDARTSKARPVDGGTLVHVDAMPALVRMGTTTSALTHWSDPAHDAMNEP